MVPGEKKSFNAEVAEVSRRSRLRLGGGFGLARRMAGDGDA